MRKLFRQILTLRRVRILIVYALIFLFSGVIGNIWMTRNQLNGLLPSIVAEDLDGHRVQLGQIQPDAFSQQITLESGQQILSAPRIFYFFAEWCPICKMQHSVISALSQDFQVIGVAMQSGAAQKVKKYVAEQGIDFTVINDESGRISRAFGVNGVPAVFVINQAGQIKYSTRGYTTEAGLRSRIWLSDKG